MTGSDAVLSVPHYTLTHLYRVLVYALICCTLSQSSYQTDLALKLPTDEDRRVDLT